MIRRTLCLAIVGLVLLGVTAMASDSEKEATAVSVAEKWLVTVDAGEYAASWREAAEFFRNTVTKEKWEQLMKTGRKPLGKLISRKMKSKIYKTSLPGAPEGEYVVIQFATSFENKKKTIETVTPMLDKDGKWRVSGYYIEIEDAQK
jgi:opacity protein-like surface antigen